MYYFIYFSFVYYVLFYFRLFFIVFTRLIFSTLMCFYIWLFSYTILVIIFYICILLFPLSDDSYRYSPLQSLIWLVWSRSKEDFGLKSCRWGGDVILGFTIFPIGIFCWFHSALVGLNSPDTTDQWLYIACMIAT